MTDLVAGNIDALVGLPVTTNQTISTNGAKALSGKIDQLTAAQRSAIEALVDEMLPDE